MKPFLRSLAQAGAELYEVGGPVRDQLMGRPVKDHDYLVRHLTVEKVSAILKPFGQITLVGRSFGVIKFTPFQDPSQMVDFVLPRKERSTGTGHRDFDVDFNPELTVEDDLGRRDFTINAMARALATGDLVDPFGGQRDLKRRLLRQVFPEAFREDPLRLMRAIQFAARLKLTIEKETWESMRENAALIATVSPERIAEELKKLLSADKPSRGFELMRDAGLMQHVIPELAALIGIEQDKMPGDDVFAHTMKALDAARSDRAIDHAGDLDLMLATLLHDVGKARTARYHEPTKRVVFFGHQIASKKLARLWMERMKMTTVGADIDRVCTLIEHHMFETKAFFTDKAIRRFISKVGTDLIFMLLDVRLADNRGGKHPAGIKGVQKLKKRIKEELERKPPFGPKDLAIDGNDIMAAGFPEGPQVGRVLGRLVDLVLDVPELNTREQLLALAKNMRENPDPGEAPPPTGRTHGQGQERPEDRKADQRRG